MKEKNINPEDSLLAKAIRIASECHEAQHDKNGSPYILHPLRMLQRAIAGGQPRSVQIVAVLHDVVEDCEAWTPEKLRDNGFPDELLAALEHVTKRPEEHGEEGYSLFVERVCKADGSSGKVARRVKILDLEDNMDVLRYGELTDGTFKRLQRYHKARKKVLTAIERYD